MLEANHRLCHACAAIFTGSTGPHRLTEQARRPHKHTHHPNLQSFRTAVEVGCYICSVLDKSRGPTPSEMGTEERGPFSTYMLVERGQIPGTYMLNVQVNHSQTGDSDTKPSYHALEVVRVDEDTITLNTPPNQRLDLLSRWVSDCCQSNNATHTACQHYRETARTLNLRKPSRLLELGTGNKQGFVRLTSLGPETTLFPAYVTLGRLGKTPSSLLTAINNNWLLARQLPKVIQDALTITQHAGARLLWTPDLSDDNVTTDHSHRGDIIAGGLFHIASATNGLAEDNETGILPSAGSHDPSVPVVTPSWESSKFAVLDPETMNKSLSPVTSDAQSYHDNYIAPATLYCTTSQLWWQCRGGSYSETFPSGFGNESTLPWIRVGVNNLHPFLFRNLDDSLPPMATRSGEAWPFVERLSSLWTQVVSALSAANTDQGAQQDRLLLVDSMATHLRDLASPYQPGFITDMETAVYRAGIWFFAGNPSVHQLLWHASKETAPGKRVSSGAVPTWSWASTSSPVEYSFHLAHDMGMFSLTPAIWPGTILDDVVAEVVSPPRLGEASLTVRGRVIPIEVVQDHSRGSGSFWAVFRDAGGAKGRLVFDVVEEEVLAKEHGTGSGYVALPLTLKTQDRSAVILGPPRFAMQGLVLRRHPQAGGYGDDDGGPVDGICSRCGWFHCDSSRDYYDEWKDVDVVETFGLGQEKDRQTVVLV
ncbi:hypothetical protein V8F06_014733 [Rhypophila decipiens]